MYRPFVSNFASVVNNYSGFEFLLKFSHFNYLQYLIILKFIHFSSCFQIQQVKLIKLKGGGLNNL